jgi:hypothetical protein
MHYKKRCASVRRLLLLCLLFPRLIYPATLGVRCVRAAELRSELLVPRNSVYIRFFIRPLPGFSFPFSFPFLFLFSLSPFHIPTDAGCALDPCSLAPLRTSGSEISQLIRKYYSISFAILIYTYPYRKDRRTKDAPFAFLSLFRQISYDILKVPEK